jgi:hypothetical protein
VPRATRQPPYFRRDAHRRRHEEWLGQAADGGPAGRWTAPHLRRCSPRRGRRCAGPTRSRWRPGRTGKIGPDIQVKGARPPPVPLPLIGQRLDGRWGASHRQPVDVGTEVDAVRPMSPIGIMAAIIINSRHYRMSNRSRVFDSCSQTVRSSACGRRPRRSARQNCDVSGIYSDHVLAGLKHN